MNATTVYQRKAPAASSSTARTAAATTCSSNSSAVASTATNLNGKSGSNPTTVEINNIAVHFPFRPYDVQTKYMKSVLDALQKGEHALLESPTGTGKTLCLLCSTLAWQQAQKGLAKSSDVAIANMTQTNSNNGGQTKTPVIIYASRTHSQLSQVVREMKNTRYRPRHAVLGSREHMCIHPKVNPLASKSSKSNSSPIPTSSDVNHSCSKLNKERKCTYRNTLDEYGTDWHPPSEDRQAGDESQPVRDMEDLVSAGKQFRVCPFYYTRGLIAGAEIIFVPYNYLFDRDARESTLAEVDFANSVLVFDEAHNLEEFASESSSFDLNSGDVAGCVGEVQRALQYLELNPDSTTGGGTNLKDNMLRLKSIFLKLEQYLLDGISGNVRANAGGSGESSHSGEFIFDIFREGAGITHANSGIFISFVRQVQDLIMEFKGSSSSSGTPRLDHFVNCIKRIYGTGTEMQALARAKSFRVHMSKVIGNTGGGFAGGRTISYWCFAPALAMRELAFLKVRSILITSGTLSPLPSFSMELGLEFPVQLENDHVIKPDQIFVRVIGKGVSGKELSSKFGRRDDPEYILELGNTLASLCRNIPGGVLIFFPSYSSLQTCVERWGGPSYNKNKGNDKGVHFFAARKRQPSTPRFSFPQIPTHFMVQGETSTPWKRLLSKKPIVLEPRSTSDLNDAIAEFKKFVSLPSGCVLMGVCRGKISEGIDFSDDMCRAVIVTGLPFAPYLDPKVKLKREFLDAAKASEGAHPSTDGGFGRITFIENKDSQNATLSGGKCLSGAEWYNQQAHRAVNQAIGRVIRHRNDYGAVLLLDHRFSEPRNQEGLSKWLRPYVRDESFGVSIRSIVQFYKETKAKMSPIRPVLQYEDPTPQLDKRADNTNQITQVAVVKPRDRSQFHGEDEDDTFIPESRIQKRFDLKEPPCKETDTPLINIDVDTKLSVSSHENEPQGINTLAEAYRNKSTTTLKHKPTATEIEASSIWDSLSSKPRASTVYRSSSMNFSSSKQHRIPTTRERDDAKQQAKFFFAAAKQMLSNENLQKTQQLLVTMKRHGDNKASQEYISTAKELLLILVGIDQNDRKRVELITLLFPLLPLKHRYQIEKMGIKCCFEKSSFWRQCKSFISNDDSKTLQQVIPKLMLDQPSTISSSVVRTSHDRTLVENLQKILTILARNNMDPIHFFNLLPEHHLRKAQAVNMEMIREREVALAKAHSLQTKGEKCINTALFQRSHPRGFVPYIDPEQVKESDKQNLSDALIQAKAINSEKKDRVMALQYSREITTKRTSAAAAMTDAQSLSKRAFQSPPSCQGKNLDTVDRLLDQMKNEVYQPRMERLNGRLKANVPDDFLCSLCRTYAKEPLMAPCGHSACNNCWKDWLIRQKTCPHCRENAEMKTLAKIIFKDTNGKEGFTQVCESESDGSEELEIIAR